VRGLGGGGLTMRTDDPPLVHDALIIDEPWISKILRGEKTWELRSRHTTKRGWIGLIRKGSGKVVGIARIIDSLGPMSIDEIRAAESLHRSGSTSETSRYRHAWVLADAVALSSPVDYEHPAGAVIWVTLAQPVVESIGMQLAAARGSHAGAALIRESIAAEAWLNENFKPTREPTLYVAGFKLPHGRELALNRGLKRIQIWVADFQGPMDGVRVLNRLRPGERYSALQPRSSNLKACTPTLAVGHPVYHLDINDVVTLGRVISGIARLPRPSIG
jgi:hypothetical protein